MVSPIKPRAVYEDLLRVPSHQVGEILDGRLHVSPRPTPHHALAASGLGSELWGPFHRGRGGPGGWWILFEPEVHLGSSILVPDVAGWRRERLPRLPDTQGLTIAPDWVCEVISPSTETLDHVKKMPAYAREGVQHLWLVNPSPRTLEEYRLTDGQWRLLASHEGAMGVRAQPFDAIALDLGALWGDDPS